jgi:hypothetical protein
MMSGIAGAGWRYRTADDQIDLVVVEQLGIDVGDRFGVGLSS